VNLFVFRFFVVFKKWVLPEGLTNETPNMLMKSNHVWMRSIVEWFQAFSHASSVQTPPQMHLDTSPTCLEGFVLDRTEIGLGVSHEI